MDIIFKTYKSIVMKPWLKWTLIAAPIVVGGIIVFRELSKGADKPPPPVEPTPTPTPTPKPKEEPTASSDFPIKKGSKGAKVRELQEYLLRLDSKSLPRFGADGSFGSETESALKKLIGTTSVNTQLEFDAIKNKAKNYKVGSPLVFQYNSPINQVSPFLTIK